MNTQPHDPAKLELRHLAPYLPYGLKVYNTYTGCITELVVTSMFFKQERKTDLNGGVCILNVLNSNVEKPILRPMSDLTKEIENGGERFVPLIRLLEMKERNFFSKDEFLKRISGGVKMKVIECSTEIYDFPIHSVDYLVKTTSGDLIYSFGYSEQFDRFEARDVSHNKPFGVGYQKQLFEQCYEWHFDLNALIPAGLAVDINTLNEKP